MTKWRREANEQEERFARERQQQTITKVEQRLSEQVNGTVDQQLLEQKEVVLAIIAEAMGEFAVELKTER